MDDSNLPTYTMPGIKKGNEILISGTVQLRKNEFQGSKGYAGHGKYE